MIKEVFCYLSRVKKLITDSILQEDIIDEHTMGIMAPSGKGDPLKLKLDDGTDDDNDDKNDDYIRIKK